MCVCVFLFGVFACLFPCFRLMIWFVKGASIILNHRGFFVRPAGSWKEKGRCSAEGSKWLVYD